MGPAGKMGFQDAIKRVLQASPQVANHPEILLSALNHMKDVGVLDPEAEDKITEIAKQHTLNRIETAKGHLQAVQEAAGTPAAAPAAGKSMPTATDPKTGAKVQWDGKAWTPIPQT
jgi:hypothetical protein